MLLRVEGFCASAGCRGGGDLGREVPPRSRSALSSARVLLLLLVLGCLRLESIRRRQFHFAEAPRSTSPVSGEPPDGALEVLRSRSLGFSGGASARAAMTPCAGVSWWNVVMPLVRT
jgi:hypothetical protein